MLRLQVSAKLLPEPLREPAWALTLSDLPTMVISSSGQEEITPEAPRTATLALISVQVPKFSVGRC